MKNCLQQNTQFCHYGNHHSSRTFPHFWVTTAFLLICNICPRPYRSIDIVSGIGEQVPCPNACPQFCKQPHFYPLKNKIAGACNPRYYLLFMVGRIRFELMTSSASRKHSPTELTAHLSIYIITRLWLEINIQ